MAEDKLISSGRRTGNSCTEVRGGLSKALCPCRGGRRAQAQQQAAPPSQKVSPAFTYKQLDLLLLSC